MQQVWRDWCVTTPWLRCISNTSDVYSISPVFDDVEEGREAVFALAGENDPTRRVRSHGSCALPLSLALQAAAGLGELRAPSVGWPGQPRSCDVVLEWWRGEGWSFNFHAPLLLSVVRRPSRCASVLLDHGGVAANAAPSRCQFAAL